MSKYFVSEKPYGYRVIQHKYNTTVQCKTLKELAIHYSIAYMNHKFRLNYVTKVFITFTMIKYIHTTIVSCKNSKIKEKL